MKHKLIINRWYWIRFLDHTAGSEDLVTCQVVGRVLKLDVKKVVITTWHVEEKEYRKDNLEMLALVKSAILDTRSIIDIGEGV